MMKMREHTQQFGAQFLAQDIVQVDFSKRPFTLITHRGVELKAQSVIIATGAQSRRLGVPGEDTYWGKGVTTCAVCDGAFYPNKKVIIVGGGDTAMEDASFMTKFTSDITIVHILDKFTASYAMQERVINNPKIKIIYSSTLTDITGDGSHVTQATIANQKTGEKYVQPVDGIFVAIGLTPNTQPFKNQIELTPYGYVKVTDQTKTSVPGIFVAGDVADDRYRQAITSAGAGCMAALDVERYLQKQG
jgi:thioredoxin reductase (NADPH)